MTLFITPLYAATLGLLFIILRMSIAPGMMNWAQFSSQ